MLSFYFISNLNVSFLENSIKKFNKPIQVPNEHNRYLSPLSLSLSSSLNNLEIIDKKEIETIDNSFENQKNSIRTKSSENLIKEVNYCNKDSSSSSGSSRDSEDMLSQLKNSLNKMRPFLGIK